eukprot:GILI01013748.1.p1 GENE.GILI01013748.1~~GILI01013748.1.p1  ORF type:complete len:322 (-),score=26.35 GILI01013748.1:74-1006(-)
MQQPRLVDIKSKVSTRTNLATRLAPTSTQTQQANASGKRGMDETTYSVATQNSYIRTGEDVPKRVHEPRLDMGHTAVFDAKSTTQKSAHSGVSATDPSFYSRARVEERKDDEVRHGLDTIPTRSGAGRMQRTVDIMRKRENEPSLAPPTQSYETIERRQQNGVPPPTKLETVRFTYAMPKSTQQLDYRTPVGQIPQGLSQAYATQRRAITESASSKDLFYSTTKATETVLPGYMAHIPSDEGTAAKLHGDSDVLRHHAQNGHIAAKSSLELMHVRSPQGNQRTTQGFYLEQAVSSPEERLLNKPRIGKRT